VREPLPSEVREELSKIVNDRLKEMEAQGLVVRRVLSERPIAVTYEITDFGRSALGILDKLQKWAEEQGV
jgi:DNA-binding HxlR family transcriptional regulator